MSYALPVVAGALLLAGAVLSGCDKLQEAQNTAHALKAASTAVATMGKEVTKATERAELRRARGDTLSIPFKELEAYLPATVGDYAPVGEAEGSTMSTTGMSYSTCARTYRKGSDENPQTLKISIVDYNGAVAMYAGATAMLGSGFQMEDHEQRLQSVDLGTPDVKALEVYRKRDRQASLTAGISQRFFVSVEASDQPDTELVKAVIKNLPLDKLAAM